MNKLCLFIKDNFWTIMIIIGLYIYNPMYGIFIASILLMLDVHPIIVVFIAAVGIYFKYHDKNKKGG